MAPATRQGLSLLLLLATGAASANIDVPSADGDVEVDGRLDESIWSQATVVTLDYETRPAENTPAGVRTEVLLVENGTELLVGFRAYDPAPEQIVAYLSDRDAAYDDDFVGIVLDTFNDERRAFEFFSNPLGIQMDLTYDDVNGNEDDSWNAIWDSAGRINEDGFVVEMAIPFRTLQFPAGDAEKTFGVDLLRFRPRGNRYRLSNNPQRRGSPCYLCQLEKMRGFRSVSPGRNLIIAPSATVARNDSVPEDAASDPALSRGEVEFEPGLDVRWGITPDVSLTATLNPDFSQVEADVAQLQINQQFALFFPERRPFFLEGADFFSTPFDAVFTRNVADPDYGAKITGKTAGHTYAAFVTDDTRTNLLLPGPLGSDVTSLDQSSRILVGRYAWDIGRNSRLGGLLTARRGDDYDNTVAGVDGRFQFAEHHNVTFQYLDSSTTNPQTVVDEFDLGGRDQAGAAWRARWSRNTRRWFVRAEHVDVDAGFRADMGFMPQVDYSRSTVGVFRQFYPDEIGWWNQVSIGGDWDITHDQQGRLLERELEGRVTFQAALQSYVEIGGWQRQRLFDDILFREQGTYVFAEMNPTGSLYFGLYAEAGDQVDFANSRLADSVRISPRINYRLWEGVSLRLRHTWQQLETGGERIFRVNLTDFRLQYPFSARSFVRLVLTNRDVRRNQALYADDIDENTRSLSSQLLFTYKVNPQTVLYLGYGDNRLEDEAYRNLTQTDRSFFLKVGYAWLP